MSKRAISLAANHGPGYVHSILDEGKEPKISSLIAVCEVLNVSVMYILHGLDVDPQDQQIIKAMRENPGARSAILALLAS